ncbi:XRE family transcriptional regulator [Oceanispirochaeta crateris]|uniref:XRE family transcriptional regulator n=1 Tax=Oceanispirochaeta crateris TaxID=2518645 RepID=A0A5C1QPD4_9SPIO|nr:XRE family transcriptional regulator [Oceanispirochaeta crateris]
MYLTQAETARGAGLLPKTVSLLENDPQRSSVGNLFKLLSFLNREVQLLNKEGPTGKVPFEKTRL